MVLTTNTKPTIDEHLISIIMLHALLAPKMTSKQKTLRLNEPQHLDFM